LEYLGSDFRFYTRLFLDGSISGNGEFSGNIIIQGTGDPSLSAAYDIDPQLILESWANVLDSLNITSIKGNILGDATYLDNTYYAPGWAWDDLPSAYSAQISALSFNDNVIDITVTQGESIGSPATISVAPDNNYVRIINYITTTDNTTPEEMVVIKEPGTNIVELYGAVNFDSLSTHTLSRSVTIDNPVLFFLNQFQLALKTKNIRFRGALLSSLDWNDKLDYSSMKLIAEHASPPLSEIIKIVNKNSSNISAELLLKTVGREFRGLGSTSAGIDCVHDFLKKKSVSIANSSIVDGSGLSRLNLVSPRYLVNYLLAMYRSKYKDIFMASLAEPNKEGTLANRMKMSLAEKKVKAKTGSMNHISNIAGYVSTRDGEELAFAIMINNYTVPRSLAENLQDLILMRLAGFSRK
jgi:PBP4 family serine-type D-alanyl-D-alanine carboxypeptidase